MRKDGGDRELVLAALVENPPIVSLGRALIASELSEVALDDRELQVERALADAAVDRASALEGQRSSIQ